MKTQGRSKYLLVITDQFSKMNKKVSLKGVSEAELAGRFIN